MGAKLFGIKQKIAGIIGSIVSLIIVIAVVQVGFFFYKVKFKLQDQMALIMPDRLEKINSENMSTVIHKNASMRELVVGTISNLAGGYLNDPEKVQYRLVSLGQTRNIDEAMVERYRLSYKYGAGVKILWAVPLALDFTGETEVLVKPNGSLSAYVSE